MKYYIYKITNKINGKIYIGYHGCKCDFLEDDYYGSGRRIKSALKKYGKENFEREVLFEYDTSKEALLKEEEIVNEEFIKRKDVYNLRVGGSNEVSYEPHKKRVKKKKTKEEISEIRSQAIKKWMEENPEEQQEKMLKINKNPDKIEKTAAKHRGMKRTEETCQNISLSLIGKGKGKDNAEFKGYYITPYGKFDSLEAASIGTGNSKICVRDRCRILNHKTVKLFSHLKDPKITKDMIGKTWKELGWGFEDA